MRKFSVFWRVYFLVCIFTLSYTSIPVGAQEQIECPSLKNQVTIDGKWTMPDEWSDARVGELVFLYGSGSAYYHLKHDDHFLYILVDYPSLSVPDNRDAAGILVDTENNGGDIMQGDDYFLTQVYFGGTTPWLVRGWGTGETILDDFSDLTWEKIIQIEWEVDPQGFSASSTTDATNNPYSSEDHVMWEFQIPKDEFPSEIIGFIVYVVNFSGENGASYPHIDIDKLDNPNLWGEMRFSNNPLPQPTSTFSTSKITSPLLESTQQTSQFTTSSPTQTQSQITTQSTSHDIQESLTTTHTQSIYKQLDNNIFALIILIVLISILITLYTVNRTKEKPQESNYCIKCGKVLPVRSAFCPECGSNQKL